MLANFHLELDVISGQSPVVVQPVGRDEALGERGLQVWAQPVLVDVGEQTYHTLGYEDHHQQYCVLKYFLKIKNKFLTTDQLLPRRGGACSRRRGRSNRGER